MTKKSKLLPTAAPASFAGEASVASQVQPPSSKSKTKKVEKAKKEALQGLTISKPPKQTKASQSSKKHATGSGSTARKGESAQAQKKPKQPSPKPAAPISTNPIQPSAQNALLSPSPTQKGSSTEVPVVLDRVSSESIAIDRVASVADCFAALPESSTTGSVDHPDAVDRLPIAQSDSNSADVKTKRNMKHETFRLVAATPVPISTRVNRQFYESQLLLYVLDKVRGKHRKRQNYHGELDQDETDLRRSFVDKLAYICDFKKGGSTVTALALQKTYQGVIFWLAANETVKPKVTVFLEEVLQFAKKVEAESKKTTEAQLLTLIVAFNKDRLDYYWSALLKDLPLCMQYLEAVEESTNGNLTPRKLKTLKRFLGSLTQISKERVELVRECFEARKSSVFETLAQLTTSGRPNIDFFDGIRHLIGRLGEHLKATKIIVSAALRFPEVLDEFEIQVQISPPSSCYFQSPYSVTLDGMASRIFTKNDEILHYQEALEALERTSNGVLLGRIQQECCFKTRVHAELLLTDLFYWRQFDFHDEDPYIGCSKPACFNCFQYILVHPGNFVLPACHNKLYLTWRTPDILEDDVPISIATQTREAITSKMNSNFRAELKRQIDGKHAKKRVQYDSVTGTSSSIQGSVLEPLTSEWDDGTDSEYASAQEDLPSRRDSPVHCLSRETKEKDDSDDDLSWYRSKVQRMATRLTAA